jgi:hypothetical protein
MAALFGEVYPRALARAAERSRAPLGAHSPLVEA